MSCPPVPWDRHQSPAPLWTFRRFDVSTFRRFDVLTHPSSFILHPFLSDRSTTRSPPITPHVIHIGRKCARCPKSSPTSSAGANPHAPFRPPWTKPDEKKIPNEPIWKCDCKHPPPSPDGGSRALGPLVYARGSDRTRECNSSVAPYYHSLARTRLDECSWNTGIRSWWSVVYFPSPPARSHPQIRSRVGDVGC